MSKKVLTMLGKTRHILVALLLVIPWAAAAQESESFDGLRGFLSSYYSLSSETIIDYAQNTRFSCRDLQVAIEEATTEGRIRKEFNSVTRVGASAEFVGSGSDASCKYSEFFEHRREAAIAYYENKVGVPRATAESLYGTELSRRDFVKLVRESTASVQQFVDSLKREVEGSAVAPFSYTMVFKSSAPENKDLVISYE